MDNCVNCKHCKITHVTGTCGAYIECKKYWYEDPVTGTKYLTDCKDIRNVYKHCSMFERKVDIIEKIVNWFRKCVGK